MEWKDCNGLDVDRQADCLYCLSVRTQVGRTREEKKEFLDCLERMLNMVELNDVLIVAGDFNAHVGEVQDGEEECLGKFGWGTRNREGQDLVEMLSRNGLVLAGTFFQKQESHKITYRSGQNMSMIDMLVTRSQQRWRIKDCKVIPGEFVCTQHKPLIFEIRVERRKYKNERKGRKVIRWGRCKEDSKIEYARRVE